jgi:MOSC domain-containing protein YiiM
VKASPVAVGIVVATHVWPSDAQTPIAVEALDLDWGGVAGDRHHGVTMSSDTRQKDVFDRGTEIRNHRQISIVDSAELSDIAAALGIDDLAPGTIADNICTSGIPHLTALEPMSRLAFASGAVLMTGGRNAPCTIAGRMVQARYGSPAEKFPKAAFDLRGITAWVERPGTIRPGDEVQVLPPTGI